MKLSYGNQLSQASLEHLLFIATESSNDGYDDEVYKKFVNELKVCNPNMEIISHYIFGKTWTLRVIQK